jgi:hypothetical protein
MNEKLFHKVKETEEKTSALIIKTKDFVDPFLEKALGMYGCQIDFVSGQPSEGKLKDYDYIFCFAQDFNFIKRLFQLTDKKTKFLFALSFSLQQSQLENKILEYSLKNKKDVRLVRFSYLYGPGMAKEDYQQLLKNKQSLGVQPLFISDFIYGLLKAIFSSGTSHKTFSLIEGDQELHWQPKVDLKEGLKKVEDYFDQEGVSLEKKTEKTSLDKLFSKGKLEKARPFLAKFSLKHWWLLIGLLLFLLLSFPFTSLSFYGLLGFRYLKQSQDLVLEGDLQRALRKANTAQDYFTKGKEQSLQLTKLFSFVDQERTDQVNNLFSLGKTTADGMASLVRAVDKASFLSKAILQKETINTRDLIVEIKLDLEKSFNQLSLAESQFKGKVMVMELSKVRDLILQVRKGVDLLPELIGLGEKKTYLVLFQNNSELRPTGGFIGSYGLLTFDQGRLIDFEVQDVYVADGQLKGHVEPPEDLKKYLGEAGWFLRDSNWDIDFPSSAARAAWFFEKEMGRVVDGVLAVNLFVAQEILSSVGEVELADYEEKIDADNFFERAEYYAEINFFPGSTQKEDFLASVARGLFEKVKESDQKSLMSLIKNLYPALISKDFLVWLDDQNSMRIIQELAWDGSIKAIDNCSKGQGCFSDYLLVSEANVGINKANYFVKRSFSHQVEINDEDVVEATLQLDYRNDSQSEAFPAGRYKNYLRLYAPLGTELVSVRIKNALTGEIKEVEEIEKHEEHDKQIFGFLIEVPIQESRSVEITYHLKEKLDEKISRYLLFLQKQSGIKDEFFSFWFKPPEDRQAFSPLTFTSTGDGLLFHPQFNQDLLFEISLVK